MQLVRREPLCEADLEQGAEREAGGEEEEGAPLVCGEGQVLFFSGNTRQVYNL